MTELVAAVFAVLTILFACLWWWAREDANKTEADLRAASLLLSAQLAAADIQNRNLQRALREAEGAGTGLREAAKRYHEALHPLQAVECDYVRGYDETKALRAAAADRKRLRHATFFLMKQAAKGGKQFVVERGTATIRPERRTTDW